MLWPARMKSDDARRLSEGEMHGLVVREEAIAPRHGGPHPITP
jgi:hypothetical protein